MQSEMPASHLTLKPGHIDLKSWEVSPNAEFFDDFTYYTYEARQQGRQPTVYSFYGHGVPSQFLEVSYLPRQNTKQHLRCFVTFKTRKFNPETELVEEQYAFTLPAWQGTNDIIHLLEVAPGETYRKFNLHSLLLYAEGNPYVDVVERIRAKYTDLQLLNFVPDVYFYEDPVSKYIRTPHQLPVETIDGSPVGIMVEAVK